MEKIITYKQERKWKKYGNCWRLSQITAMSNTCKKKLNKEQLDNLRSYAKENGMLRGGRDFLKNTRDIRMRRFHNIWNYFYNRKIKIFSKSFWERLNKWQFCVISITVNSALSADIRDGTVDNINFGNGRGHAIVLCAYDDGYALINTSENGLFKISKSVLLKTDMIRKDRALFYYL